MIAIYTRQSKDRKDSISIETQIEFCKREIYNEEFKVYEDKGFTGANINRPDFQELMRDIKDGLITKVVVYRLDRISRSILNFTSMMEIFNKYNVEFVSCTEKLDTTTPAGRMVVNILIVFAQYERESTQQRIVDNYYERAKRGVFLGGNTPFGYDSGNVKIANKKTSMLVVNKEDALNVQKIYDMYVNKNMTLGEITKYFNSNNIFIGKGDKGCFSNTISRIIRNPVYVKADYSVFHFVDMKNCIIQNNIEDYNGINGLISYGAGDKKFTDIAGYNIAIGLHEGIISSDLWLKAQYRIYNNKQIANNGTSTNTWLSGISKCGYCGYAMTYKSYSRKLAKGIKTYKHLRCSGKTYKRCNGDITYIHLEEAEQSVFEALVKHVKNISIEISSEKDNEKIKDLEFVISLIDKKIDNLISSLTEASEITMHYINKMINELHEQKKKASNEIMKYDISKSSNAVSNAHDYISDWDNLDMDSKKYFVQMYIKEIRFYSDKEISIDFK